MNDLITMNEGVALLSPETALRIAEYERKVAEIKKAEDELRESIFNEMQEKGIKKIDTEDMTITFKDSYDREFFDSKAFRAEHPDMYDSYIKMSTVKATIMIKLKEDKG